MTPRGKGRSEPSAPRRRRRRPKASRRVRVVRVVALCVVVGGAAAAGYLAGRNPGDLETAATPSVWTAGRVRIEVLNAGGVTGMARTATGVLREAGFDVVSFGNASSFDPDRPSEVVDRVGRTDVAQAVAAALGIGIVQSDPDPNLYVDVSVVLGREWIEPARATERPDSGATRWWDPRSWLDR